MRDQMIPNFQREFDLVSSSEYHKRTIRSGKLHEKDHSFILGKNVSFKILEAKLWCRTTLSS